MRKGELFYVRTLEKVRAVAGTSYFANRKDKRKDTQTMCSGRLSCFSQDYG